MKIPRMASGFNEITSIIPSHHFVSAYIIKAKNKELFEHRSQDVSGYQRPDAIRNYMDAVGRKLARFQTTDRLL